MSKVFESQSLTDEADKRKKQYEALEEQLRALKQAFQGVADLGDALKGKGADNIKDFFQGQAEIADSWLTLVSAQIAFLNGISGDIKDQELSDTYAETSFLEHELPNADLKASEIVSAHKAEIDSILSGISDIIHLDTYTLDDYADKMGDAQKTRRDTITAVDTLDESLTAEYQNLESLDNAVLSKYSVLMQATSNGKSASPMYYDKKAFHSNEIYKSVMATEKQGTDYIDAKAQQAEARRLQEKAEEEANKPWYEKTWDGICNFTGEVTGYYDYKRAAEGVDPVTGEKLSTAERVTAGAMAAAGFIPVVGWAGRAFKGGKAIYKTGKTVIAAEHALDAYKTGKSLDILKMTEMGAYGLVASNGFSEAVTGRDMFGNKVSEEKRKQGALEAALSLVGAGSLAKSVDHSVSMYRNVDKGSTVKVKLSDIRHVVNPTHVKKVAHQTYQSVKKRSLSVIESAGETVLFAKQLMGTFRNQPAYAYAKSSHYTESLINKEAVKKVAQYPVNYLKQVAKDHIHYITQTGKVFYDASSKVFRTSDGKFAKKPKADHVEEPKVLKVERQKTDVHSEGTKATGELNKDLAKAYLRDIEAKTGRKVCKEQIDHIKEALRNNNYEKLTPKETAKHRSKFTSSLKDRLIAEWEEKTNQKWPRYTEEVFDKHGEVARSIGQPYDAHHIIENNFGGPHEWWNIHPAKYPDEHQAGIHGKGAPSGKLFPRR
ncbi:MULTISPECIES: ribonuclease YeeF family protein [Bacillus amyloliquefaciens group]|uniref:ribonuclease YeeF family protein n=1 Tax=Bacillus amyloliquefaciens group TaxID=1938374 RepID=UPI00141A32BD|nr:MULTISPECIES: T7SS effector LXG polymorphic toxin [Bacillus amyloliquefaciens group]MBI0441097.1 transposase [Bacillus velezensis]NIH00128.1 transposase [Bacillus amyloliquefaciens]UYP22542.1 T7SS effector LXG polymorphic toxin [Bacillus velezensis]